MVVLFGKGLESITIRLMVRVIILVALLSFPSLARARQAGEQTQPGSKPATTKPAAKAAAAKAPRDLLARARAFYNEGRYDDAMTTAAQAHGFRQPDVTAAAWLIIGRARLERFREKSAVDDLQAAREAL